MMRAGTLSLLVAANTALAPLAIDAYLPALPQLASELGTTVHRAELSISIFLGGFAVGQLVCGPLSDRLGRKPILMTGLLLFMIASVMLAMSSSLAELFAWRFVQALGGGASVVNSSAIVRDCFKGRDAAKVMSTMAMIMMLAPLVAPLIGSILLYLAGWQSVFLFLAGYAAMVLLVIGFGLPETHPGGSPEVTPMRVLRNYASVLSHREARGYICAVAMSFSGLMAFVTSSPFVYMELLKISPAAYPFVFGANIVFVAMCSRMNVRLLRNRSPRQNLLLGLGIQFVSAMALMMVALSGMVTMYSVVPFVMLFVGAIGLVTPNAIASVLEYFPHISATAAALMGGIKFVCAGLAGFLVTFFEVDSIWPMVLMLLCVSVIGNLGLRLLTSSQGSLQRVEEG
jgi:MFS transporter, DHA1 family, multidrug resistance protein